MEDAYLLYSLLKESFLLLDFGDRQLFDQFGLSTTRYYALFHIAMSPGISPSRLSNLMFCDKSNATRLLQGLEAEGYVVRRSHEFDRRTQRLYLTESGAALQRHVTAAHIATVEHRLEALADDERGALAASLQRLNGSLSANLQQSGAVQAA